MSTTEDTPLEQAGAALDAATEDFRDAAESVDARPEAPETPGGESATAHLPRGTVLDIINASDLPERIVDVPEWGVSVLMRGLTLGEVSELEKLKEQSQTVFACAMLAATIADPVFTPEQAGLLNEKSAAVITRLVNEMVELNGIGAEEERALVERFQDE